MRTAIQLLVLSTLAALVACEARAAERVERTLTLEQALDAGAVLSMDNLLGSIRVRGGDAGRVARFEARVVAEAKTAEEAQALADAVSLERKGTRAELTVHPVFPVDRHAAFRPPRDDDRALIERWVSAALDRDSVGVAYDGRLVQVGRQKGAATLAVHLTVELPMDVRASFRQIVGTIDAGTSRGALQLDVVEGRISADHVYGKLTARSAGGSVEVTSFSGEELAVETASGRLALEDVQTRNARLTTGSGSIEVHGIRADRLAVSSSSGDVAIAGVEPGELEVETATGDVDLAPSFSRTREAAIRAGTGNVVLRVSEIASFSLSALTRSGQVQAEGLELDPLDPADGRSRYQIGIGGPTVEILAQSGSVLVRPQR